jgi:hypothetical protein
MQNVEKEPVACHYSVKQPVFKGRRMITMQIELGG